MEKKHPFLEAVCRLSVPVALQSMLQSSFSMVDQVMVGRLGSVSVAGVGFAGKFSSLFSVLTAAIGSAAGILISQYLGQNSGRGVRRSFFESLAVCLSVGALFLFSGLTFPRQVMGLYTEDPAVRQAAAEYLTILSGAFLPMAGATMLSTLFRCAEQARLPLYASLAAALLNTGLNAALIFGKWGFPAMGARGAAVATVASQTANFLLMLAMLRRRGILPQREVGAPRGTGQLHRKQYCAILLPMLACEAAWSLGENGYAAIYGHMSTAASAAMTLSGPVQGLVIGALSGLSQAAGVLIGKKLGAGEREGAYQAARRLLLYGAAGALALSAAVVLLSPLYAGIYRVEDAVKRLTRQILLVYAFFVPFKVLNMILGGGILRSGGKTALVMVIDIAGTWGAGIPLALLSAFVWKLPVPQVYLLLSLEECVRFGISLLVFRKRTWMRRLPAN